MYTTYQKASLFRGVNNCIARRAGSGVLLVILLIAAATAKTAKYPQTIVFMTDFGVMDDSVAICRGVMYSIIPDVRIVDLTHQVTPFSILDGARCLYGATPYSPAGTVFVVVIDPTVGSTRKAIVARSKRGQLFVLPDNGLLTRVEERDGMEAVIDGHPDGVVAAYQWSFGDGRRGRGRHAGGSARRSQGNFRTVPGLRSGVQHDRLWVVGSQRSCRRACRLR